MPLQAVQIHKKHSVPEEKYMAGRVTIQDIADALGLSRNTVSKAINNTGILADATREKILQKAMEMGYKTFSYANSQMDLKFTSQFSAQDPLFTPIDLKDPRREVALFTGLFLDNGHFASTMLDKFQYELTILGYSLTIHRVLEENMKSLTLPLSFRPDNTAAIICVEIFHYDYCKMLCGLNLPLLLVDAPVETYTAPLPADLLLMENASAIHQIIYTASQNNITRIGFVGHATHCRSFYERFMAFREAMYLYSVPINESYCLTACSGNGQEYRDSLKKCLSKMKDLPELFICANDFVAIDVLTVLREMGVSCPEDILLSGFDDSPESKVVTPPLTTCHIHSQIMGASAAHLLISRIRQPHLNYRTLHAETDLIYRASTREEFHHA